MLTAVHRGISFDVHDMFYTRDSVLLVGLRGKFWVYYVRIFCRPHHRSKHLYAVRDRTYGRSFSPSFA